MSKLSPSDMRLNKSQVLASLREIFRPLRGEEREDSKQEQDQERKERNGGERRKRKEDQRLESLF